MDNERRAKCDVRWTERHREKYVNRFWARMPKLRYRATFPFDPSVVLKPSCRIRLTMSVFWTGFASMAAKTLPFPGVSACAVELYALTEIIGVSVFLLLVFLMYLAAVSPSTLRHKFVNR